MRFSVIRAHQRSATILADILAFLSAGGVWKNVRSLVNSSFYYRTKFDKQIGEAQGISTYTE